MATQIKWKIKFTIGLDYAFLIAHLESVMGEYVGRLAGLLVDDASFASVTDHISLLRYAYPVSNKFRWDLLPFEPFFYVYVFYVFFYFFLLQYKHFKCCLINVN